jgi:hypothetical protein
LIVVIGRGVGTGYGNLDLREPIAIDSGDSSIGNGKTKGEGETKGNSRVKRDLGELEIASQMQSVTPLPQ